MVDSPRFPVRFALAAAIAGLFFYCTGFGLVSTKLGYDDVMNITFAWEPSLRSLLLSLLSPFSSLYRPTGSAIYRLLFELFGLDPLPFRIFFYGLLLINLYLVYKLGSMISRSREIGALAAILYCFHGRLVPIYRNNGTLYDVLCTTLALAALGYYIHSRQLERPLNAWRLCLFLILFVLSLNAKEMAAGLAPVIFFYELIFHRVEPALQSAPRQRQLVTRLRQYLPFILCSLITLAAAKAKMGDGSVMHATAPYAMTFTLARFLEHWGHLMGDLFYLKKEFIRPPALCLIWAGLLAVAALSRRKHVWFFLAFSLLTPLPVIFIPFRGFFVMYLPLAGWTMFIAAVILAGKDYALARLKLPSRWPPAITAATFTAAAFAVAFVGLRDAKFRRESTAPDEGQTVISGMTSDILGLEEPLPKGARVLFLHDRFPKDAWGTVMIARLLYTDRDLWADRPTMMDKPPVVSEYNRVFDYRGGKLAVIEHPKPDPKGTPLYYPE